jgi:hypothetical protein
MHAVAGRLWRSRVSAINAQGSRGVKVQAFGGNGLATSKTPAKCAGVNSAKRGFDPLHINVSTVLGGLGHGLPLEGIHSGDPPDGRLIQFHRLHSFLSGFLTLKEFVPDVKQKLLEMSEVQFGRGHDQRG